MTVEALESGLPWGEAQPSHFAAKYHWVIYPLCLSCLSGKMGMMIMDPTSSSCED